MEIQKQIKKYRTSMQLSQEMLAEKVYVTRQTISNWENGRSYPDINSLLLLSSLFEISLDELIKGDVEIMKKTINEVDVKKLDSYGKVYSILFFVTIISIAPLIKFLGIFGLLLWLPIFAITFYVAFKIEKIYKRNDVSTYKEIIAFSNGEMLDDIQKQREIGKRPYQNVLKVVFGAVIGASIMMLILDKIC